MMILVLPDCFLIYGFFISAPERRVFSPVPDALHAFQHPVKTKAAAQITAAAAMERLCSTLQYYSSFKPTVLPIHA